MFHGSHVVSNALPVRGGSYTGYAVRYPRKGSVGCGGVTDLSGLFKGWAYIFKVQGSKIDYVALNGDYLGLEG